MNILIVFNCNILQYNINFYTSDYKAVFSALCDFLLEIFHFTKGFSLSMVFLGRSPFKSKGFFWYCEILIVYLKQFNDLKQFAFFWAVSSVFTGDSGSFWLVLFVVTSYTMFTWRLLDYTRKLRNSAESRLSENKFWRTNLGHLSN